MTMQGDSVSSVKVVELMRGEVEAFSTERGEPGSGPEAGGEGGSSCSPEAGAKGGSSGESREAYAGFNACHYTGDAPEHVAACRQALAAKYALPKENIIIPRQTHSTTVATIDRLPYTDSLEGVDGLVSNLPGVMLAIHTADCVPLVMADSSAGVIAAVHAGWRGAVAGIVEKAVERMIALGATAANIRAAMGPCICRDCFEVGEEVASQFPEECVVRRDGCRPHVDLPLAVALQLTLLGVAHHQIAMPPACSRCNPDRFFSARRLGINSGRTTTAIIRM